MPTVTELPPRRDIDARVPAGYRLLERDCFGCRRDFRVYLPDVPLSGALTHFVRCPYCRCEAEVPVDSTSKPILVEGCLRS